MALLEIEELSASFAAAEGLPRQVLNRVSLKVEPGTFTAIVGESGSGKSLTCLSILGLVESFAHVSGSISLGSQTFAAGSPDLATLRGRKAALIFQDPVAALNPVRSIGAQLVEALRVTFPRLTRRQARERGLALLEKVKLDEPARRIRQYPHELSGGQNQRVMIALALATEPELLIADEPTTALDARTGRQVLDLLDALRREQGLTMLLISHDLGLVWDYADKIYVMQAGQVVEEGTIDDLRVGRHHSHTAELMQAAGL